MTIAPLQAFGLGDIIFCQTLAQRWIAEGHKVVWGVLPHYVEGLNRAYPHVTFVDYRTLPIDYERRDEHDCGEYRVIPLRWADSIMKVPYSQCMASKYSLFGLDWQIWKEGAMFERDLNSEWALMDFQGITSQTGKYIVRHANFGSNSQFKAKLPDFVGMGTVIDVDTKYSAYDDREWSLFDWATVYENAKEIHAVSSSNLYLFELLDLTCPIHIYKREPIEHDHNNYDYILTKPNYILH